MNNMLNSPVLHRKEQCIKDTNMNTLKYKLVKIVSEITFGVNKDQEQFFIQC